MSEVTNKTRNAIFNTMQEEIRKRVQKEPFRVTINKHRIDLLYETYDIVYEPTWTLLLENLDD